MCLLLNLVSCTPEAPNDICFVYKGEMTVFHDESQENTDIEDIVLGSVEERMSNGDLTNIQTVERVTYLGDSMKDVTNALGPLETIVEYYYTVETTAAGNPDEFAAKIEDSLLEGVVDDVSLPGIGAITTSPADSMLLESECFLVCHALLDGLLISFFFVVYQNTFLSSAVPHSCILFTLFSILHS